MPLDPIQEREAFQERYRFQQQYRAQQQPPHPSLQDDFSGSQGERIAQTLQDVPRNIVGGVGAAADFLAMPPFLAAQGVYGIGSGIKSYLGSGFDPETAMKTMEQAMQEFPKEGLGKVLQPSNLINPAIGGPSQGQEAASEVLSSPWTGIHKAADWMYGQGVPAEVVASGQFAADLAAAPLLGMGLGRAREAMSTPKLGQPLNARPEPKMPEPSTEIKPVEQQSEPIYNKEGELTGFKFREEPNIEPGIFRPLEIEGTPVEVTPMLSKKSAELLGRTTPKEPAGTKEPTLGEVPSEEVPSQKPRIKLKLKPQEDKVITRLQQQINEQEKFIENKKDSLESVTSWEDTKKINDQIAKEQTVLDNLNKQLETRQKRQSGPGAKEGGAIYWPESVVKGLKEKPAPKTQAEEPKIPWFEQLKYQEGGTEAPKGRPIRGPGAKQGGAVDIGAFYPSSMMERIKEWTDKIRTIGIRIKDNFKSDFVDNEGVPIPVFHGTHTGSPIDIFISKSDTGIISFSTDPRFASNWSGAGDYNTHENKIFLETGHHPRVIPAFLKVDKVFDFSNFEHLKKLEDLAGYETYADPLMSSYWIEVETFAKELNKAYGFDAFLTKEGGVLNVHILDPNKIVFPFDPNKTAAVSSRKGGFRQGGAIDPDLLTLGLSKVIGRSKKPQAGGVQPSPKETTGELLKAFQTDVRTAEQLVRMEKEGIKDIPPVVGYITPDRGLSTITKNPLVRWIVEHANDIIRGAENQLKELQYGADAWKTSIGAFSRGFEHMSLTKGSGYKSTWGRLTLKEQFEVQQVWMNNQGKRDFIRADFSSDKVYQAADTLRTEALDKPKAIGDRRIQAQGGKKIPYIPGYFPKYFNGPFLLRVLDPTKPTGNQTIGIFPVEARFRTAATKKKLEQQFPGYTVELLHNFDRTSESNVKAFVDALNITKQGTPEYTALADAVNKLFRSRGAMSRTLKRKNQDILGFKGSEPTRQGLKEFIEVFDTYARQWINYERNQKLADKHAELLIALRKHDVNNVPNFEGWMADYLDNAKGRDLSLVKEIDNHIPYEVYRFFSNTSHLAAIWFLGTIKFGAIQLLQPVNILPKMSQLWVREGTKDPLTSVIMGAAKTIKPDKTTTEGLNWAKRHGQIDSRVVDLADENIADPYSFVDSLDKVFKFGTGKIEQEAVRTPMFVGLEYQLRDRIPNKLKRFEIAAKMTDFYAVNYMKHARALIWQKGGFIGRQASQFTSYGINFWTQGVEYAKSLPKDKGISFLTYLGVSASMAGVINAIGVPAVISIFDKINDALEYFGEERYWDNTEEWLHKHLPRMMEYGVPSWFAGQDLSASVSPPRIGQLVPQVPPSMSFPYKIAKEGTELVGKFGQGLDTSADWMRTVQALTPNQFQGLVEKHYTPEGGPVPNPRRDMEGTYIPSQEDWRNRLIYGTRSLDWADAIKEERFRLEREKSLKDFLDLHKKKIVDDLLTKGDINIFVINNYAKKSGDPKELVSEMKKEAINRMLPYLERYLFKKLHGNITDKDLAAREMQFQKDMMEKDDLKEFSAWWDVLRNETR